MKDNNMKIDLSGLDKIQKKVERLSKTTKISFKKPENWDDLSDKEREEIIQKHSLDYIKNELSKDS